MTVFTRNSLNGMLTKQNFIKAFNELFPLSHRAFQSQRSVLLELMFNVFDRDANDLIDPSEFLYGMSIWCKGSLDNRLRCNISSLLHGREPDFICKFSSTCWIQ